MRGTEERVRRICAHACKYEEVSGNIMLEWIPAELQTRGGAKGDAVGKAWGWQGGSMASTVATGKQGWRWWGRLVAEEAQSIKLGWVTAIVILASVVAIALGWILRHRVLVEQLAHAVPIRSPVLVPQCNLVQHPLQVVNGGSGAIQGQNEPHVDPNSMSNSKLSKKKKEFEAEKRGLLTQRLQLKNAELRRQNALLSATSQSMWTMPDQALRHENEPKRATLFPPRQSIDQANSMLSIILLLKTKMRKTNSSLRVLRKNIQVYPVRMDICLRWYYQ
ncbi:hypothetical protein BC830DRAFT_1218276 [Chytriomyces sp. MP71]|nr:hypothetical protein BC830DRAFT_1218276 [Chytriomyces sp. MP71]